MFKKIGMYALYGVAAMAAGFGFFIAGPITLDTLKGIVRKGTKDKKEKEE